MHHPDFDPILVVVEGGRYDCFSLKSKPTPRDQYLIGFLKSMGGINESVEPGRYYFNIIELDEDHHVASLEPVQE